MNSNKGYSFYILRMCVDPAQGHHIVLNLCLEHFHLISHVAVIMRSALLRDNQRIYDECPVDLITCQDSACFHLFECVRISTSDEFFHYFNGTVDRAQ